MSDDLTWRKGAPPAIGWFHASTSGWEHSIRWWDGEFWSMPATEMTEFRRVSEVACMRTRASDPILWRHQPRDWPANARTYSRDPAPDRSLD